MTHEEWKDKVLDAVDSYAYAVSIGGDGRQSIWDGIVELLDQKDKS